MSQLLYEGKAKKIWSMDGEPSMVRIEFKDSLTAFNAQKKGSFPNKGEINCEIAALIFQQLQKHNLSTHWVKNEGRTSMIARKVSIIPLEVVVRNILAGSTAKKMGRGEGEVLKKPLVEFYYKNDELQDPFVSDDQVLAFEICTENDIAALKSQALQINQVLKDLFLKAGLNLVDFKIEFGRTDKGELLLADEITPDCCRLWDVKTNEKFDKDRFRRDLGKVEESYAAVLGRLKEVMK